MPANIAPIFPITPTIVWAAAISGNQLYDGTGTTYTIAVGGTNGSRIEKVRITPSASAAQCVVRFFVNNGQPNSVAANNTLIKEQLITGVTISQTAAKTTYEILLDIALPPTYRLLATLSVAHLSYPIHIVSEGGDF